MSTQQSNEQERERKNLEKQYTYEEPEDDNIEVSPTSSSSSPQQQQQQPKSEWEKYLEELDEKRLRRLHSLARLNSYTIDGQEYKRRKIRVREFNDLERLRALFNKQKDPVKATNALIDVYAKCAEYYLGIDVDTFENLDWEEVKTILDACNFRTIRGLPN